MKRFETILKILQNRTLERYMIGIDALKFLEGFGNLIRHVERYSFVRQFCEGVTVDVGCGSGYGSWMISRNPDVEKVIGIDIDPDAIEFAIHNYSGKPEITLWNDPVDAKAPFFINADITKPSPELAIKADTMVAIEIIEHLDNPEDLGVFAAALNIQRIIVSYPMKKTTHYNKFHKHDLDMTQVIHACSTSSNFGVWVDQDFHGTHDSRILVLERARR